MPAENPTSPYVRYRAASDRPRLTELLLRPQRAAGRQMWFSLMSPVSDRHRLPGRGFPLDQCYGEVDAAQRWPVDQTARDQLAGDKQRLYRILTTATAA